MPETGGRPQNLTPFTKGQSGNPKGRPPMDGEFKEFDGSVISNSDDFNGAEVAFVAKVASISTDNERRDNHLKSDDFFNAEKYPEMKFKGMGIFLQHFLPGISAIDLNQPGIEFFLR